MSFVSSVRECAVTRLKSFNPFYTQFACRNNSLDNSLILSTYNVTARYNVTIAPNMPDATKLNCISTPWVRLFSRYTMPDLSSREITQRPRCLCTSFDFLVAANDGNLFVGDHHELPFPAGPLRPEISHGYLRGSLLRVERLGIPIQHISGTLHSVYSSRKNLLCFKLKVFQLDQSVKAPIALFYLDCLLISKDEDVFCIFQMSETWNPHLEPRLAHISSVVFLTFSLHLIDRQVCLPNHIHVCLV